MPLWLQACLNESHNGVASLPTIDIVLRELRVPVHMRRLIAQGDPAGAYRSRSEALFAVIRAMVGGGHPDPEISAAVLNPAHVIGAKAREKGFAWLQGEIARTRTKAHVNGGHSSAALGLRKAPAHPPLRFLTIAEIKARPKPAWLIEPLIPQGALCVMYGPSGCGKTFLALEWALSIGSDVESLGHAVSPGPVIYVAAEGAAGLDQRKRLVY
jgi:hypothetical protein